MSKKTRGHKNAAVAKNNKSQIAENKNIAIMRGREKYNQLFKCAGIELNL